MIATWSTRKKYYCFAIWACSISFFRYWLLWFNSTKRNIVCLNRKTVRSEKTEKNRNLKRKSFLNTIESKNPFSFTLWSLSIPKAKNSSQKHQPPKEVLFFPKLVFFLFIELFSNLLIQKLLFIALYDGTNLQHGQSWDSKSPLLNYQWGIKEIIKLWILQRTKCLWRAS